MNTKTDDARHIPIGRELREVLGRLPVALDAQGKRGPYIFTQTVFKRYNTIDEQDPKAAQRRMNTYMDTMEEMLPPQHLRVTEK